MTTSATKKHNTIHNTKNVRFNNSISLSHKILCIINSNPRQKYNAKLIDQVLEGKFNYNKDEKRIAKIRTELNRLADRSKIRRMSRGFFQAKATLETIAIIASPETKLHKIKIEIKKMEGISTQYNILDWLKNKKF